MPYDISKLPFALKGDQNAFLSLLPLVGKDPCAHAPYIVVSWRPGQRMFGVSSERRVLKSCHRSAKAARARVKSNQKHAKDRKYRNVSYAAYNLKTGKKVK